jgi:hypothetical protein
MAQDLRQVSDNGDASMTKTAAEEVSLATRPPVSTRPSPPQHTAWRDSASGRTQRAVVTFSDGAPEGPVPRRTWGCMERSTATLAPALAVRWVPAPGSSAARAGATVEREALEAPASADALVIQRVHKRLSTAVTQRLGLGRN